MSPEPAALSGMMCSHEQMRVLSLHIMDTVKSGRPDAKPNGRIIFYWT